MNYSLEARLEAVRMGYRASLWSTAVHLLGYKDLEVETHLPIIKILMSPIRRKLICIPRGCFKSSIASVAYPIWRLMRDPNIRILLDSELYTNSKNFLREITQHLESEKFVSIFGDWRSSTWNQSEIIVKPRNRIIKEASITAGGIGTTKVGQHFDLIIGDDYNSPQNSQTQEGRKSVIDHYQYNRSILDVDGEYAVVGTRYSEDDIIGHIIRNELGFDNEQKLMQVKDSGGIRYV